MIDDGRQTYTDAPPLNGNLLLGSLQLLFWLFFHPSAWRNHLIRISYDLRPDFCFAGLKQTHWRNGSLWRMLIMTYLLWPPLVGLFIAAGLRLLGQPPEAIALGVIVGVAVGLVASITTSVAGSVAIGVPVGIAIGGVVGLAGVVTLGGTGSLAAGQANFPFDLVASTIIGLASGLAGGLAFCVAAGVGGGANNLGVAYSLTRQISGVIIGIIIGVIASRLAGLVTGRLAAGLAVGIPFGLAVGLRTQDGRRGFVAALLAGFAGSLAVNLGQIGGATGLVELAAVIALLSSLFTLPYVLAERIAGSWAGAMAGALGSGAGFFLFITPGQTLGPFLLFSLAGILLGLTLAWWRPVLMYPFLAAWNILLLRLDENRLPDGRSPLLPWHSAFWDEFQRLPLVGLDTHLLLLMDHRPAAAAAAIDYLSTSRQRWAAQSAQIEIDARQLAQCRNAEAISHAHRRLAAGELVGPASALLRSFSRVSQDVEAAQRQESAYNRRLALSAVEDRLDGLLRELTRSNERYAARFRPIAAEWRRIIAAQGQQLAEEAELRQEIDSPYIIGVPLTDQQEIFIGRTDISARIEQLLLDRRQPPLLLYGQRRVGKTSLLNNLGRLLPSTIIPLFVDLQGPASRAKDGVGFLYNFARGMIRSAQRQRDAVLPPLTREMLTADPFTVFDEWLDDVESALGQNLVLLMLDEFEVLASMLDKGHFDEESILGMLRHLIQHRTRFKVLLSGSHTLDEFQRWSSYLINVQVIHIGYLKEAETRQLVENPVQGFALRYEPEASRRVTALTRGHPFLVQLLCAEVVALKNEQPPAERRLARLEDVNTAVPHALQHGSFFFADIEQNQVDRVGLEVLRLLAEGEEDTAVPRQTLVNFIPSLLSLEKALVHLQQRELIEPLDDGYRFQVELVRRWFAQRP